MIEPPDIPPLTAEEARMLQDDLRLSEHLADHTLNPDYRDELWERKQQLGAALDRSRTRSWLVWHQHKKGVA